MEYASYLAGEKWSDNPTCTHDLLAGVARVVNDQISDEGRVRLVPWIPSVIGLNGEDPGVDVGIAMRCAAFALPVVADYRQRALAVGLLTARQVLTHLFDAEATVIEVEGLLRHSELALRSSPHAATWAREFADDRQTTAKAFRKRSAPAIVRVAVVGMSEACVADRDSRLMELLTTVIGDCHDWLGRDTLDIPVHNDPGMMSAPSRNA